jgi:hypothetical protein
MVPILSKLLPNSLHTSRRTNKINNINNNLNRQNPYIYINNDDSDEYSNPLNYDPSDEPFGPSPKQHKYPQDVLNSIISSGFQLPSLERPMQMMIDHGPNTNIKPSHLQITNQHQRNRVSLREKPNINSNQIDNKELSFDSLQSLPFASTLSVQERLQKTQERIQKKEQDIGKEGSKECYKLPPHAPSPPNVLLPSYKRSPQLFNYYTNNLASPTTNNVASPTKLPSLSNNKLVSITN